MAAQKTHNTTNDILNRLEEFLQAAGTEDTLINITEIIGVSRGYFSTIRSKNAEIGVDKIVKILLLYPQLSGDWLLTGTGFMIKDVNSLKEQSEILAREEALKIAVSKIDDIQDQLRELHKQISKSKTKPKKLKQ
jgi:hydrogenase maturation factor